MPKDPEVELAPKYKVGDTVIHKAEGTEHQVLKVVDGNILKLSGLAGQIRASAVKPK